MAKGDIIIKDVRTKFSIEKGNGLDIPRFRGHFNHNDFHYKISMKGTPMPNIFNGLMDIPDLKERISKAQTKEQIAYTILWLFGEASNIINNKHKKATFKVSISDIDNEKLNPL